MKKGDFKMKRRIACIALSAISALSVFALCSCSGKNATDYSLSENWFRCDYDSVDRKDTKADVIWFYGTCVSEPSQENGIANIEDGMRDAVPTMYNGALEAFDDGVRIYSPYYRQVSLNTAMEKCFSHDDLINMIEETEVYTDISAALDYYFKNYNEGRPFIIAGFSQGGASVQAALDKYFTGANHKQYLDKMVAAYSIGYGVDKNWVSKCGYKFTEGALDTGCIISWNTEGPGEKGSSILLCDNTSDTLLINPANWKTDETYVKAEECAGSYVNGQIVEPGAYNLQIDKKRGSVICDNNEDYVPGIWGGKSLHIYDMKCAFVSIRQNMHDRINAFTGETPAVVANAVGIEKLNKKVNYESKENWVALPASSDKDVDVIYYYPTTYTPAEGTDEVIADIDDAGMREGAKDIFEKQATAFAESCNVYAPYYRQVAGTYGLTISEDENADLMRYLASKDATDALDYYFEHYNNGKPFVLAGHSQGSGILTYILEDYFSDHPDYYERMVAAYVIGGSVTEKILKEYPHLKVAESETDTGVIISWNTEGPENIGQHNAVVYEGAKTINPLNWKTDDTYASAEENKGSLLNGEILLNVADAQVNVERGTVITNASKEYAMPETPLFGPACFHGNDYGLFYNNIKENVQKRIDSYYSKGAK